MFPEKQKTKRLQELPAMQNDEAPTKRLRRPNVRLHQPYYDNPGHRRLQQQWKAFKKDLDGSKRIKNVTPEKGKKNGGESDRSDGEETAEMGFEDDNVAIGNWRNLNLNGGVVKDKDKNLQTRSSRRKRVRFSSKRWVVAKESEDQENEKLILSSDDGNESEKGVGEEGKKLVEVEGEGKGKGFEEEKEEDLVSNRIGTIIREEDSDDQSTPDHHPFGVEELVGDENNVDGDKGKNKMLMLSGCGPKEVKEDRRRRGDGDGVSVWLDQLGLGKYASLFEVHEVDEEVLPFLTLEDLKDMGISAVGSRRKIYRSIQKLGKGFS